MHIKGRFSFYRNFQNNFLGVCLHDFLTEFHIFSWLAFLAVRTFRIHLVIVLQNSAWAISYADAVFIKTFAMTLVATFTLDIMEPIETLHRLLKLLNCCRFFYLGVFIAEPRNFHFPGRYLLVSSFPYQSV